MNRDLEGQYALVTGASRGIGRAIADKLAEAGSHVAIAARNLEQSRSAAAEISVHYGVKTLGLQADIASSLSVRRLFQELEDWSARQLDILICNAGYPMRPEIWNTPLHSTPADKLTSWYLDVFATDAMGSVYCTYEALPWMMARHGGRIIYISSTPALTGYRGVPYTMAKAAILGLMKEIAAEYGKENIRANALALGNIMTPATLDQLDEDVKSALASEAPLKRWGTPEEVGNAILFLASESSSFITGQILVVDGGTLRR
jgi:3-oxoacyl-[acyl-carrier protein] reductase